jgi:hypothetical protein
VRAMKHRILAGTLVSAALTLAGLAPTASAAQVFNVTIPVNEVVDNPCNGESVTLTGVVHELLDAVDTPNGGDVVVDALNAAQLTGSGSYGNAYHVALTDLFVLASQATVNPAAAITELSTFEVIGEGSVPDFRMTVVYHVTYAHGDVVSDVAIVSTTCTG